jgi:deoxyribodipyrimidine photolyase-related protein
MKNYLLILGDQLFENHTLLDKSIPIIMIESTDLTNRYNYHKFKLAYIFTCMREYASQLKIEGYDVFYFSIEENYTFESVFKKLKVKNIRYLEPTDKNFSIYLKKISDKCNISTQVGATESEMFLTPNTILEEFFTKQKPPYLMHNFYKAQRKRLKLFVDSNNQPYGGKWSFDDQNRSKIPRNHSFPKRLEFESEKYNEVKIIIETKFQNNPGKLPELYLPTNHKSAKLYFDYFLQNHLENFGNYEDAIDNRDAFLYHSVISPLLNNGLLTPSYALARLNKYTSENPDLLKNSFNSIEGFIRQIIGWREFMWGLYKYVYSSDLTQYNFFDHNKDLPEYFYFKNLSDLQNTPLKDAVEKTENYAYNHHIERLMILGNWMTLSEYDPKQCYKWFIEMYIDAYDWVMVGNVYGMGLFADGGIFATKPYISSANYIRKMSHYGVKKPGDWGEIWDTKFWNFLLKHETLFLKNPRMSMLIKSYKNRLDN